MLGAEKWTSSQTTTNRNGIRLYFILRRAPAEYFFYVKSVDSLEEMMDAAVFRLLDLIKEARRIVTLLHKDAATIRQELARAEVKIATQNEQLLLFILRREASDLRRSQLSKSIVFLARASSEPAIKIIVEIEKSARGKITKVQSNFQDIPLAAERDESDATILARNIASLINRFLSKKTTRSSQGHSACELIVKTSAGMYRIDLSI